jgi:hypothetical protein
MDPSKTHPRLLDFSRVERDLEDIAEDALLDIETRIAALDAINSEVRASSSDDWNRLREIAVGDDPITAPVAARAVVELRPETSDLVTLARETASFWARTEIASELLERGLRSSEILEISRLDAPWIFDPEADSGYEIWELQESAPILAAVGSRLGRPLLVLLATSTYAGGFMNECHFEALLLHCGPSAVLQAWRQLQRERHAYGAISSSEVARVLTEAGYGDEAIEALGELGE